MTLACASWMKVLFRSLLKPSTYHARHKSVRSNSRGLKPDTDTDTFLEAEKTHPKSRNTKKTARLPEHFRKVRANFCLTPCETSQETDGNCSEKLVHMNFFILGGFFRVDFPPVIFRCSFPPP